MQNVSFLNLEYLILKLYNLFSVVEVSELPATILSWVGVIEFFAVIISLVFLYGVVYSQLRVSQVNHQIEHKIERARQELFGRAEVKNERWLHVLELAGSSNPSDWRQAIIEADILLDRLLDDMRIPGESLGEKLKNVSRAAFTTLDMAWEAHKVRNQIAHDGAVFELTARETKRTIDLFRQVFLEFDYI